VANATKFGPFSRELTCVSPGVFEDLFDRIVELEADGQEVQVRCALFEVYGEDVYDLLQVAPISLLPFHYSHFTVNPPPPSLRNAMLCSPLWVNWR